MATSFPNRRTWIVCLFLVVYGPLTALPLGAQSSGFPSTGDAPELLGHLYRGDYASIGTSGEALSQVMVTGQVFSDLGDQRPECRADQPRYPAPSPAEVSWAMLTLPRKYPGVNLQVGLAGRGHPTYARVLAWVTAVGCDHPAVHRLAANSLNYVVWLNEQGTSERHDSRRTSDRNRSRRAPVRPPAEEDERPTLGAWYQQCQTALQPATRADILRCRCIAAALSDHDDELADGQVSALQSDFAAQLETLAAEQTPVSDALARCER